MPASVSLKRVVATLRKTSGPPEPLPARGPFEMILWENVAYLANDERHAAAFEALSRRVGLTPHAILAAPESLLVEITAMGGIHPRERAERLRTIAGIAIEEHGGKVSRLLGLPMPKAKAALRKFPAIGAPGAEKILMHAGVLADLALESNGLRVLVRLGFGEEKKTYAATYRRVKEAIAEEIGTEKEWLVDAHHLLRRHGREICKVSTPRCEVCPLTRDCRWYALQ